MGNNGKINGKFHFVTQTLKTLIKQNIDNKPNSSKTVPPQKNKLQTDVFKAFTKTNKKTESWNPSANFKSLLIDEEIKAESSLLLLDPSVVAYAKWAMGQPDVDTKKEALDELINECKKTNDNVSVKEVADLVKDLHANLIKAADEAKVPLPFDWLRQTTKLVASMQLVKNHYGFGNGINNANEIKAELTQNFNKIAKKMEGFYGQSININSPIPPFNLVSYIKKNYPINEPANTWAPQGNLTWYIIENNQLKELPVWPNWALGVQTDKPYTMVKNDGNVYVRLDDNFDTINLLNNVQGSYSAFVEKANKILAQIKVFDNGIKKHGAEQVVLLSKLAKIYHIAYVHLMGRMVWEPQYLASLGNGNAKSTSMNFTSPEEAEFEKTIFFTDTLMQMDEFEKAVSILMTQLTHVQSEPGNFDFPQQKEAALILSIMGAREKQIISQVFSKNENDILITRQLQDALKLKKLSSLLSKQEATTYYLQAVAYESKAYKLNGKLECAFNTSAKVNGQLFQLLYSTLDPEITDYLENVIPTLDHKPSHAEMAATLQLAKLHLTNIRDEAFKYSESGNDINNGAFKEYMSKAGMLIYKTESVMEKYSDAISSGTIDNFMAEIKGVKAEMLWTNKQYLDAACYVRDEIDQPFWNTPYSKYLRNPIFSFIPLSFRISSSEDSDTTALLKKMGMSDTEIKYYVSKNKGRIKPLLDHIDTDNIKERVSAAALEASNHLFDHPWYVWLPATAIGCGIGFAITKTPLGCAKGASIALGGDMAVSATTATPTMQAYFSNYTNTTTEDAAINYGVGGLVLALNTIGFRYIKLVSTPAQKIGQVATYKSIGKTSVSVGKTIGGFSWASLSTAGQGIKWTYQTTSNFIKRGISSVTGNHLVQAQVKPIVVPKKLMVHANKIWQVFAGKARDLGPQKVIKGLPWRTQLGVYSETIKWNPFIHEFEFAGVGKAMWGIVQTGLHYAERFSAPYLSAELLFYEHEDDEPSVSVFGAFASMFFFQRIGIQYLGLDKGGTRLMLGLDRMQDVIMQWTSGEALYKINWEIAMLHYITGSVPGQARGRWLKNYLGKYSTLTSGVQIKVNGYASGKIPWSNMSANEKNVVKKLLQYANVNGVVALKNVPGRGAGAKILKESLIAKELKDAAVITTEAGEIVPHLTQNDWKILRRLVRPIEIKLESFAGGSEFKSYLKTLLNNRKELDMKTVKWAEEAKLVIDKLEMAWAANIGTHSAKKTTMYVRNNSVFLKFKKGKFKDPIFIDTELKLTAEEQKLLRSFATTVKYPVGNFIPPDLKFMGLKKTSSEFKKLYAETAGKVSEEHLDIMVNGSKGYHKLSLKAKLAAQELWKMSGQNPFAKLVIKEGTVFKQKSYLGKAFEKAIGKLSPAQETALRSSMNFPQLSLSTSHKELMIKVNTNLNVKGALAFCGIHDTLIGTVWDEIRGVQFLQTTPGQMGSWTFVRSFISLPLRNIMKLKAGWDKPLAVFLDRMLGRNFIDPLITKWIPLWPEKALWKKSYDESYESGTLDDFINFHVAKGFKGGLHIYNFPVTSLSYISSYMEDYLEGSPYKAMPGSYKMLSDVYKTGKLKKKKKLTKIDYLNIDNQVDALLTQAEFILSDQMDGKYILLENKYWRKDAVLDSALGIAAAIYAAKKENPDIFPVSTFNHSELFNMIKSKVDSFTEGPVNSTAVERFMENIVDDGSYKVPKEIELWWKEAVND